MKVLVVGSGGREHALSWKIAQSDLVDEVICAPGNAGIAEIAVCVPVAADDIAGLVKLAKEREVGLTVVGPEAPLCEGIVDAFERERLQVFGPSRLAAEIEGSKAFARRLAQRNRIPQPGFWIFEDKVSAQAFLENRKDGPIVVKASGLAAGKGVTVAADNDAASKAIRECMEESRFGDSGSTVVLEECIEGPEVSIMCLTDGSTLVPLETAGDHKPVFDGDEGPNTGGMGAVSPVRSVMSRAIDQIEAQILLPAVHGLNREDRVFKGVLYAGLMMTQAGPRLLEFNARFGDPETQPLMMRLKSDIVPFLVHAAAGSLEELAAPEWDPRP
ncbi:MAG: phosphoribosylamine--glycine ligase, partial [Planctomycetota bacterium]